MPASSDNLPTVRERHGAKSLAINVSSVGTQDVHLHAAVDGQGCDERFVGGTAIKSNADDVGGRQLVDDHPVAAISTAA